MKLLGLTMALLLNEKLPGGPTSGFFLLWASSLIVGLT